VVAESAVMTVLAGFSSAWATDAALINPRAANPTVHLLTFIVPPMLLVPFPVLILHFRGQIRFAIAHLNRVHLSH
jgi:ABC-type uncharacterized transport system permease subunit